MKPQKFIGEKVIYDKEGQMIFGQIEGKMQLLLDVRGWGSIQNIPEFKGDLEKAAQFQDELGEWIADAINKKLQKQ